MYVGLRRVPEVDVLKLEIPTNIFLLNAISSLRIDSRLILHQYADHISGTNQLHDISEDACDHSEVGDEHDHVDEEGGDFADLESAHFVKLPSIVDHERNSPEAHNLDNKGENTTPLGLLDTDVVGDLVAVVELDNLFYFASESFHCPDI